MNNSSLKYQIEKTLINDKRLWVDEAKTILNETKLIDLVGEIDEGIIEQLLENKVLRDKFFIKIKNSYVFNMNDFRFFIEENSVDNSYTKYANRIGLATNQRFIKDNDEVVLNFPFKDCILEGGQSNEEGKENYYEYNETVTKTQENQGFKAKSYNLKTTDRKEVFFNQVLAKDEIDRLLDAKALVNWKRYTVDGKQPVGKIKRDKTGVIKENLVIKGNNLLALHSLESQFTGKVKLIYIDPPFNTGSDSFKYNDKFNHSTWLTFMKNRFETAKRLLSDDGFIIVHIDAKENAYLKILMDEIFSPDNFLNVITVRDSHPSGLKMAHKDKTIIKTKSLIYCYRSSSKSRINPLYQVRESWDTHFNTYVNIGSDVLEKERISDVFYKDFPDLSTFKLDSNALQNPIFKDWAFLNRDNIFQSTKEIPKHAYEKSMVHEGEVISYTASNGAKEYAYNGRRLSPLSKSVVNVSYFNFPKEDFGKLLCDFWDDIDFNNTQNEGGVSFPNGKKPENLIARIISMFSNINDLVLDYHLGSSTTIAVAQKMKRQYIGIEQMDYIKDVSIKRLYNVIKSDESGISKDVNWKGGGDFIYFELAKWNEAAKDKINKCIDYDELISLFDELYERYFLNYNVNIKKFRQEIVSEDNFKALTFEEQKQMFLTMLDLNQMYVNYSEMSADRYCISKEDQELTKSFYGDGK